MQKRISENGKNMTPDQAKEKISEITDKIRTYNREYYEEGESSVDDNEYDLLITQLSELEHQYPEHVLPDSPTLRVGGQPTDQFENVRHNHPMLSLSNLYNEEDLREWVKGIQTKLSKEQVKVVCEVKIDGFAISIIYSDGKYSQAVTRGNGEVGDDVTANAKTIKSLPLNLGKNVSLELRGEVYLSKENFDKINLRKARSDSQMFKNPRNAAAGSIRLKDPKAVALRGLDILLYDIAEGQVSEKHSLNLNYLESLDLPVNTYRKICDTEQEILDFCNHWQENKETLPFEIDGVVIKLEELSERQMLGFTAKSPRWATAWKFKSEKARSKLLNVENSIGRTGILTPVANLEPVQLLGTEVKRATLHNYDQISRLDIRLGDTIFVEKGGDIIPKIVGVDYTERQGKSSPLVPPDECPVCETRLAQTEGEVDLRCENPSCPAVLQGSLEHFVSKKGMDIRYLGSAVVGLFIEKGFIRDIADIYSLPDKRNILEALEGFGTKSVDNLIQAIEKSKGAPMNQFIYALGIRHIGEKAAKSLAKTITEISDLLTYDSESLESLEDFGTIMSESVGKWLAVEPNRQLLDKLIGVGVQPAPLAKDETRAFTGKTIVITGTLSRSRNDWIIDLEKAGFKITSSVSKKTDFLLAGEKAGSKLQKAKSFGVAVLSEDEIQTMIENS